MNMFKRFCSKPYSFMLTVAVLLVVAAQFASSGQFGLRFWLLSIGFAAVAFGQAHGYYRSQRWRSQWKEQ